MKIGIITIHKSPSYGASLQTFALWKYISQNGFDCEVIDLYRSFFPGYVHSEKFIPLRADDKAPLFQRVRNKLGCIKNKLLGLVREKNRPYSKGDSFNTDAWKKFVKFNSQISYSKAYHGNDELYKNPPLYDIYISGSDQLWNPAHYFSVEPYFLTWAPQSAKKISYASSIGITELRENEKQLFSKWLNGYDSIGVREIQAKKLIETFTDLKVEVVPDPTFLLKPSEWSKIAVLPTYKKPYILMFFLTPQPKYVEYCSKIAKQSGFPLVVIGSYLRTLECDGIVVDDAGIEEFLGWIENAEMVLTDSFHGTVFSIIMGAKNFSTYVALDNSKGSRIFDLLELFNLSNHCVRTLDSEFSTLDSQNMDRKEVLNTMGKIRNIGCEFLERNLKC